MSTPPKAPNYQLGVAREVLRQGRSLRHAAEAIGVTAGELDRALWRDLLRRAHLDTDRTRRELSA